MDIETITQCAYTSRSWAQDYQNKHFKHFSECLGSLCAIASAHLSNELTQKNIAHKLALCDTDRVIHCFIVCENHIVDITATQFGYVYKPVEIIDMHQLDLHQFPFWEVSTMFDDVQSLLAYQRLCGWEKVQRIDACKEIMHTNNQLNKSNNTNSINLNAINNSPKKSKKRMNM